MDKKAFMEIVGTLQLLKKEMYLDEIIAKFHTVSGETIPVKFEGESYSDDCVTLLVTANGENTPRAIAYRDIEWVEH